MKVVIVFNHPYEGSYCNAILDSVSRGLEQANNHVDIINLDKDGFNPVMTAQDLKAFRDKKPVDPKVIEYKNRLENADHAIFIFPIWWELMPALMKGFIDKVRNNFVQHTLYEVIRGYKQPDFSDYFHLNASDMLFWKDVSDPDDPREPNSTTYHVDSIISSYISYDSVYSYNFV